MSAVAVIPTGPTLDHASYLGASDIGVLVGESHMARDESDVWGEKKGHLHFEGSIQTDLGNALERPFLDVWARRGGFELTFPGTMRHPEETWAGATGDALRPDPDAEGSIIAVEAKLVGYQMLREWGPAHLGAEGVPASVVCQVHWQAWVLRACGVPVSRGQVVMCSGTELRVYDVPIDDDLIDELVSLGRAWWERHVIGDVRPEGRRGRELVAAIHPANLRKKLDPMTDVVRGLARAYEKARGDEKTAGLAKDALATMLCEAVGDGSGFEDDLTKVTWKKSAAGTRSLYVKIRG